MRRLTQHDDRGVTTLFVVLTMPFLLLAGVLVFDGGRGVVAGRQTQNAADAGALAKAADCARVPQVTTTSFTAYETNGAVLDTTKPTPVCGSDYTTTVWMKRTISPSLNLGLSDKTVRRPATAMWGAIGGAVTAPVVIAQCTFDQATASGTTFPSVELIIPLGSGAADPACPGRPPGAFGWLDTGLDGPCSIQTTLNASGQLVAHGNTGNGNVNPWDCITQVGINGTIMIPIYDASCKDASPCVVGENTGTGDNNYYLILGYAEIQITGWNLQHGSPKTAGTPVPSCPGSGSASCIRGHFVQFVTQLGSPGPGGDFGGKAVYLTA